MVISSEESSLLLRLFFWRMLPGTTILLLADMTCWRAVIAVAVITVTAGIICTTSKSTVAWLIFGAISSISEVRLTFELLFLLIRDDGRLKLVDEWTNSWWWVGNCESACRNSLTGSDNLVMEKVVVLESRRKSILYFA